MSSSNPEMIIGIDENKINLKIVSLLPLNAK